MMYLCEICGTTFDAPAVHTTSEIIDGHARVDREELCPICGESYFEEAVHCEVCGCAIAYSRGIYRRCKAHKAETLEKFKTFVSGLTDGEVDYLQDKTDGVLWRDLL